MPRPCRYKRAHLVGGTLLAVLLCVIGGCTPQFWDGFARGMAGSQSASKRAQQASSPSADPRCPSDNSPMYFTGQVTTEFGKLLKLYRCPLGHEYWINVSGNSASPSAVHPCPICGQETYFTGETRTESGVLQKVYRCPVGHLSDLPPES